MKKLMLPIMTALLLLSFVPTQLSAVTEITSNSVPVNIPVESAPAETLLNRLDEINTMDKSELSGPQKKALRKEVRGIKQELKEQRSQGVYLSVGAIIIIVLLLIILL